MADAHLNLESLKLQATSFDYVWFSFTDMHGIACGKVVPSRHVGLMLDSGLGVYSGVIFCGPQGEKSQSNVVEKAKHSNVYTSPVTSNITPLPWLGSDKFKVGEILCELRWPDNNPVEESPRYVVSRQLQRLETLGFNLHSAFENKFILTKNGQVQSHSSLTITEAKEFMSKLGKNLFECGIEVECLHAETNPEQMQFTLRPQFGIKAADDMFLFKRAAKEIAKQYDMQVCFMATPFKLASNNSCHFNHSLWSADKKTNAFWDVAGDADDNISNLAKFWMGGIVKHVNAITALCCPTVNCYRYVHDHLTMNKTNWNYDTREGFLRTTNHFVKATFVENRIPTSASSYHLVMAATVAAGIDGIENKIELPPNGKMENITYFPKTLDEALYALESDQVIVKALGKQFVDSFLCEKRNVELSKFGLHDISTCVETELEAERNEYFEFI